MKKRSSYIEEPVDDRVETRVRHGEPMGEEEEYVDISPSAEIDDLSRRMGKGRGRWMMSMEGRLNRTHSFTSPYTSFSARYVSRGAQQRVKQRTTIISIFINWTESVLTLLYYWCLANLENELIRKSDIAYYQPVYWPRHSVVVARSDYFARSIDSLSSRSVKKLLLISRNIFSLQYPWCGNLPDTLS